MDPKIKRCLMLGIFFWAVIKITSFATAGDLYSNHKSNPQKRDITLRDLRPHKTSLKVNDLEHNDLLTASKTPFKTPVDEPQNSISRNPASSGLPKSRIPGL